LCRDCGELWWGCAMRSCKEVVQGLCRLTLGPGPNNVRFRTRPQENNGELLSTAFCSWQILFHVFVTLTFFKVSPPAQGPPAPPSVRGPALWALHPWSPWTLRPMDPKRPHVDVGLMGPWANAPLGPRSYGLKALWVQGPMGHLA